MVYFTDDENEELASLKRQFDVDILDADEYKDAKAVILEAAKKRRTGDVRPAPKPEPAAAPAAAPASATVTSTNSSATTPTAMGHAKLFATTSMGIDPEIFGFCYKKTSNLCTKYRF